MPSFTAGPNDCSFDHQTVTFRATLLLFTILLLPPFEDTLNSPSLEHTPYQLHNPSSKLTNQGPSQRHLISWTAHSSVRSPALLSHHSPYRRRNSPLSPPVPFHPQPPYPPILKNASPPPTPTQPPSSTKHVSPRQPTPNTPSPPRTPRIREPTRRDRPAPPRVQTSETKTGRLSMDGPRRRRHGREVAG